MAIWNFWNIEFLSSSTPGWILKKSKFINHLRGAVGPLIHMQNVDVGKVLVWCLSALSDDEFQMPII